MEAHPSRTGEIVKKHNNISAMQQQIKELKELIDNRSTTAESTRGNDNHPSLQRPPTQCQHDSTLV